MKKISFFILVFLIGIILIASPVLALTANSSSYTVGRFGTGLATSDSYSANYESLSLSESQGTTRNAESDSRTINIGFFDNTPYYRSVSISSYTIYPTSAVEGSIISLSMSALNSESVWAVLTLPNSTLETIAMTNNVNSYYTANVVGTYTVTLYANNSQGNLASVIDTFDITSSVVPPVTPPQGGGGTTTTIIEECAYIWDCTSWSICSGGIQERLCENVGDCTGTEGKPIESRECSDALFDVVMKLEEVELTQNKTLKFSIDLKETKGIEKIDVYIKYSIIDESDTQIFSQIETRAIQGNLTYKKEISEIKLEDGEYILRVDILYGNLQRAYAEQSFKVTRGGIAEEEGSNLLLITIIVIVLVLFFIIFMVRRRKKGKEDLMRKKNYKYRISHRIASIKGNKKHLSIILGLVGVIILLSLLLKSGITTNLTGNVVDAITGNGGQTFIIILVLILVFVIFFITRKMKLHTKIKNTIEGIKSISKKKHTETMVGDLINKKVYSSGGQFIGRVEEVMLGNNRIESLRITLDKSHGLSEKGIIVSYKHLSCMRDVIMIDKEILSFLLD